MDGVKINLSWFPYVPLHSITPTQCNNPEEFRMVFDASKVLRSWLAGDRPSEQLKSLLDLSLVQFVENEGIKITIPEGSYEEVEPFLEQILIKAALFEGPERSFSVWEKDKRMAYYSPRAIKSYEKKGISLN
ncbi:hypothetical protein [Leptolyngbya sp. FACHB-16]|uniref:hypothetical protein n=1 Tax=unclassified Leptolyngbya TaxID=2650499 RepID=UPI00168600E7|nr:hypothetical protein [Leptolyngbya sp. FACHB-16]MBD2153136.1 hypothetical protein [Leptolyngbya sp. FACHB-16]